MHILPLSYLRLSQIVADNSIVATGTGQVDVTEKRAGMSPKTVREVERGQDNRA